MIWPLSARVVTLHPLTIDDIHDYWVTADKPSGTSMTESYGDFSGSNTKFCVTPHTYNATTHVGTPTTLEKRVTSGGKMGTEVATYKLVGNTAKGTPWCSFSWSGADTLGCGVNGATGATDFRPASLGGPATCTGGGTPCNHFLDPVFGPNSTTGYDMIGIRYKFYLNHFKP
jgi:hypothetical protein